jgi:undecaprenyldiphospho-muramoylpentapeptide beta-N-acetylglucosaminyltransferase
VIAAGGTAGHVVPALAVADALRAEGAEVTFIGGERAEADLVPAAGYPLRTIGVEGLSRGNPLKAARSLARAAGAFLHARALLGEIEPDAVMGGGGYVAGPVGAAALTRRIPLVLTEADSHMGLSNRALAPWAQRVCLAFPPAGADETPPADAGKAPSAGAGKAPPAGADETPPADAGKTFPPAGEGFEKRRLGRLINLSRKYHSYPELKRGTHNTGPRTGSSARRYRVTGRPIPPFDPDRARARGRLGIAPEETCVLVFGGSLGARTINLAAVQAFAGAAFRVLHVSGKRDYPELCRRELPEGYDLREYLDLGEFADALSAADLVVARAGGSVFEIAAHGVPSILVPYPHAAGDHQSANARWMAQGGAAVVLADGELTAPRLAREVATLLTDRSRLRAMGGAALRLARPDAAQEVARELLRAAGR